jgi:hypothetical protein
MYIVYTEYPAHCIYNVILGVCKNMNEVIEIIWNFSRLILKKTGHTFEENRVGQGIIKIGRISTDDYSILEQMYNKYEEELDELIYSEEFNGWKPEVLNVYFWYGVFMDSEEPEKIIFSKDDCNIIKKIIKNSKSLDKNDDDDKEIYNCCSE